MGDRVLGWRFTSVYENGIKKTRIKSIETTIEMFYKTFSFTQSDYLKPVFGELIYIFQMLQL